MRIAYLHGLEAPHKSVKNEYLSKTFEFVYDPPMNYRDLGLFGEVLQGVKEHNIDLIIGSSMGGFFAHRLSTLTGIPVLLFNPAVVDRSFDPVSHMGVERAEHTIVLGAHDDVINPIKSLEYFKSWGANPDLIHIEDMGHRNPLEIFQKYVNNFVK
jgi:pimeloyl-ACP methyl ester carboxylesterase